MRKYKLIHYAARRTNTDRRKLSKGLSKVINPNKSKRGFLPNLYKAVITFYNHDNVSTALLGKRHAKKVKQGKPRIQKRVLNAYLSNLHQTFVSEYTIIHIFCSNEAEKLCTCKLCKEESVCAHNIKITLSSWKCLENTQGFQQTQKHLSSTEIWKSRQLLAT